MPPSVSVAPSVTPSMPMSERVGPEDRRVPSIKNWSRATSTQHPLKKKPGKHLGMVV